MVPSYISRKKILILTHKTLPQVAFPIATIIASFHSTWWGSVYYLMIFKLDIEVFSRSDVTETNAERRGLPIELWYCIFEHC